MGTIRTTRNSIGVRDRRLAPCPDRPNCVSTQAQDPRHAVEPIAFTGSGEMALKRLRTVLRELPRITIVVDEARYIHAEARSRLFRFIDDLEFLVDDVQHVIHFRSASRVGLSDFGVNRKRAAAIRASFEQFGQPEG